ncbi:permease prefix domain 1-containing protein [Streptosporangium sp. NBC_01755]|uniref:permease prefix domain 1-containing protein n=1 Tax=unclassified Streptosporangium TaxID=2632669 RepID=UPI002DDBD3AB|nr:MULTISPECIES: permease prefix domain 1-containing protein [unclassified Streptosporangium]WSA28060.1 permease prefix domain 1-containing protein [Streptosporangium sp. NBC_01810]WSD00467.1 permease prefix domain 1-containing protein [Streptosporangium sp. NBC_01755]
MAGTGVIDDYVTGLSRALRGPRGPRLDMITEARDSLLDTAEALESGGLGREEAERAAVEEFGAIGEIAPDYQEELSIAAGRRLAVVLFLTVPLTTVMWSAIWKIFPTTPMGYETSPDWFVPVARGLDILQMLIGVLGGIALFALGRGLRRIRRPRLITRFLGMFVWAMLPVMLVLSGALMLGSRAAIGLSDYPPGVGAALVSYAFWGLQLYGAFRCLSLTRRGPVPACT